jgi:hypothetical protein
MGTLPAQLLLELADARRQAGGLGRGAGCIAWRLWHHATCRDASAGLVSVGVSLSVTANSRRGWRASSLPQRGHSSRDEYAAAVNVGRRQDWQCV